MGTIRLGQIAKRMIKNDFQRVVRPKSVRFSRGEFRLVVQALHNTGRNRLLRTEPVSLSGSSLFHVGGSCLPVGRYEGAFIALSASSGKFGRPQSLNRGLDDVPGKLYYILAGSEDRATQACDPSAEPVAIRRYGLGPVPGPFPSRWQPLSDKRKLDTSAGLRITHTKQRGASCLFWILCFEFVSNFVLRI